MKRRLSHLDRDIFKQAYRESGCEMARCDDPEYVEAMARRLCEIYDRKLAERRLPPPDA